MPAADTVLLPICVGLTLLGVIVTGIAWRGGKRGRVVQGIGLALAPVALYLTGLLRILWDFAVAVVAWAASIILSPTVWLGIGLLGLCIVLWVVGGIVARRTAAKKTAARDGSATGSTPQVPGRPKGAPAKDAAPPLDDDMAEIEALLKKRGIE
jgi:hypothetical protein